MMTPPSISQRPRLLLLAYACSPAQGSECAVGWNRAVQASRFCETWVMTLDVPEFRDEIEEHLNVHGPFPNLHFVWIPPTSLQTTLDRIPGFPCHIGYRSWHRAAFAVAQRLHAEQPFDLVHHVSWCGYREPGDLWKLDAPFIWGPVGGAQNYPWRFLGQAGVRDALLEVLRTVVNHLQLRYSARVGRAARQSAVVLTANSTNHRALSEAHGVDSLQRLEIGVRTVKTAPRPVDGSKRPLRMLWSGRLISIKGLPLLFRALAQLPQDVPWELQILGDGPRWAAHRRLAARLGVADRITWFNWLPHHEALAKLDWADLFIFTSLRDTTGTVVLEALAAGVPIVGLDHQGVHDVVTDDCGIKIPVTTPRKVIRELAAVITRLSSQPTERARLSRGALERARNYLWSAQGEHMAEVYRRVLAGLPQRDTHSTEPIAADGMSCADESESMFELAEAVDR